MEPSRYTEEENKGKKGFGKKKDGKTDKKDKGYMIFEEEHSEEESLVIKDSSRTPMKLKKHSKPSFKFPKKPKEKEKEKEEKRKDDKEKKKDDKFKLKKKKMRNMGSMGSINAEPADFPVFGVSLEVAVQRNKTQDGILLPAVFRECIDYIEEYGLAYEGIYRITGVKSKVQALKEAYNKQIPVYLKEYEPSVVASLLKQYLRELPEPVLTTELTPKFEQASTLKSVKQKVEEYQRLIEQLPDCNRFLLSWTIVHLTHVIAREKQNKMSLQNVSIVLSPTMQISHRVLNVLFTYSKILFKDTAIKKYVPLKPVTSRWSLDLPDSPSSLEDELKKQESLLDELHKELMKVKDTNKEEQLWEVQRVVTGLKRKIKMKKKAQESPRRSPKSHRPGSLELSRKNKVDREQKSADSLQNQQQQQTESSKKSKLDTTNTDKRIKLAHTPSKQMTELDLGDDEQDSSAKSQRQPRRSVGNLEMEFRGQEREEETIEEDAGAENEDDQDETEVDKIEGNVTTSSVTESHKVKADDSLKEEEEEEDENKEEVKNKEQFEYVKKEDDNEVGDMDDSTKELSKEKLTTVDVSETVLADSPKEMEQTETSVQEESSIKVDSNENIDEVVNSEDKVLDSNNQFENTGDVAKPQIKVEHEVQDSQDSEISVNQAPIDMTDNEVTQVTTEETKEENIEVMEVKVQKPANLAVEQVIKPPSNSTKERVLGPEEMNLGGVEPERLAAALNELVKESEEDLNQRVMSEFVHDFGIEKTESLEQDEEYQMLLQEHQALMLEEEELRAIGDELGQKIETEQNESERLREEILEIQVMREDLYSSDSSTESSSEDDSVDGDTDLYTILNRLLDQNQTLEANNKDLCDKIHQERQICLEVKVQIRMLQAKQLESSMSTQLDLLL